MHIGISHIVHLRVAFLWRDTLLAERARWILWLPVAVGVGAAFYFALPAEPPKWLGAVLLGLTVLAAIGLRRRAPLLLLSIGLAGVATGFAASQLRTNFTAAPVLEKRIGSATVTGRIVSVQSRGTAVRWLIDDLSISRLAPQQTPERIRLTNRVRGVALEPGMRIRVRATLMPPPSQPRRAPSTFHVWPGLRASARSASPLRAQRSRAPTLRRVGPARSNFSRPYRVGASLS